MEVLAADFFAPWAAPVRGSGCPRRMMVHGGGGGAHPPPPAWRPAAHVGRDEADGSVVLRFETPGFPRSALGLALSDDSSVLTVSGKLLGKRKAPAASAGAAEPTAAAAAPAETTKETEAAPVPAPATPAAAVTDASAGAAAVDEDAASADGAEVLKSFEKAYRLPRDVDAELVAATYEDGVLTVRVPKKKRHAERRTIPIIG
ncbi:hypothetical protein BU14_0127s0002 [Porphyra umbilicalis]|uniref:SHSP domain-containing protein n=1 Tax=Porphyra umbilicalis TaxID=2786 RepID=A0A1X6PAL2_PORUM|nr:hypothetical protein BU14_0127s0002 [Porphyra umbilicalis]|eukprot:OSX77904.1 hypothetical protein BU14_0127s0002 [Porphyra umbilicalis]